MTVTCKLRHATGEHGIVHQTPCSVQRPRQRLERVAERPRPRTGERKPESLRRDGSKGCSARERKRRGAAHLSKWNRATKGGAVWVRRFRAHKVGPCGWSWIAAPEIGRCPSSFFSATGPKQADYTSFGTTGTLPIQHPPFEGYRYQPRRRPASSAALGETGGISLNVTPYRRGRSN